MSKKQDDQSPKASKSAEADPQSKTEEALNLHEALSAKHLSAAQVRNLQSRLGNRAVNAMMSERVGLLNEEGGEEEREPKKEERNLRPRRSGAKSLTNDGDDASGAMGRASAFWEQLFGGDDDEDTPVRTKNPGRRRRNQPWRPARLDQDRSNAGDRQHQIGPRRPDPQESGHRFFYAMDCWLSAPKQWSNPDPSALSLINLEPWHPLSRCHRAGEFWLKTSINQQTRDLAKTIQADPVSVGHCTRITRAVGLLALTQAAEAESQNPQRVADATAVALQESAMRAMEALAAEAMLSTDCLFKFAVMEEFGDLPEVPKHQSTPHKDCPLLLAALRFALPKQPLPALLWVPTPKATKAQSDLPTMMDGLLAGSPAPTKMRLRDLSVPLASASNLLNSCGEMRLDFAAAALALWRTCGQHHYHAMRGLLAAADSKLRKTALLIAHLLEEIENLDGAPKESAHAKLDCFREQLEKARESLANLEIDVHCALVRLCTDRNDNLHESPWRPTLGSAKSFAGQWLQHESTDPRQDEEQKALLNHCTNENNPWLWIRAKADWYRTDSTPAHSEKADLWLENTALHDLLHCTMLEESSERAKKN